MAFMASLALLIGIVLGLLGGGGSILTVPVLVYIMDVPPKQAIATSLVVVGAAAAVAATRHALGGRVRWRTGLVFSAAGMVGALGGGMASGWFSGRGLLVLFALMMVATGVAMLVKREGNEPQARVVGSSASRIVLQGLAVGGFTGLVGAGGGFLVVPALALLGGLGMPEAVGTSLLVIALSSAAGWVGHAAHVDIDWMLAGTFAGATILGTLVGSSLAARVPSALLRRGFAVFVLVMAGAVLFQEVSADGRESGTTAAALEGRR